MPDHDSPAVGDGRGDRRFVHYDPESDTGFSTTLAMAVADAAGVQPTDLDPLAYTTDPAKLDALVESPPSDGVTGEVHFAFGGFNVTVHPSGLAELRPRDGDQHA
jgi:hypothetical protein